MVREGARRMIVEALELEVEPHTQALRNMSDEPSYPLAVRNGKSHHGRTLNLEHPLLPSGRVPLVRQLS